MNPIISDIINSFESKTKSSKKKYTEFLSHVYIIFDKKISSCKKSKLVDKYKKMRINALRYITANEKVITAEICKNK